MVPYLFFLTQTSWHYGLPNDLTIAIELRSESGSAIDDATMSFDDPFFQEAKIVKWGPGKSKGTFFVCFDGSAFFEGTSWDLFFFIPLGDRPPLLTCFLSSPGFAKSEIDFSEILSEWRENGRGKTFTKIVFMKKTGKLE